ncbi:unnamed protein product [Amoebophrya sp. A25]|nr:unnamed protein product [Amoebophrya sp. A25]|eukprot:GSA25T00017753001.1
MSNSRMRSTTNYMCFSPEVGAACSHRILSLIGRGIGGRRDAVIHPLTRTTSITQNKVIMCQEQVPTPRIPAHLYNSSCGVVADHEVSKYQPLVTGEEAPRQHALDVVRTRRRHFNFVSGGSSSSTAPSFRRDYPTSSITGIAENDAWRRPSRSLLFSSGVSRRCFSSTSATGTGGAGDPPSEKVSSFEYDEDSLGQRFRHFRHQFCGKCQNSFRQAWRILFRCVQFYGILHCMEEYGFGFCTTVGASMEPVFSASGNVVLVERFSKYFGNFHPLPFYNYLMYKLNHLICSISSGVVLYDGQLHEEEEGEEEKHEDVNLWRWYPSRGQVVVLISPENPANRVCKRVIGLPGDLILLPFASIGGEGWGGSPPYRPERGNFRNPYDDQADEGPLSSNLLADQLRTSSPSMQRKYYLERIVEQQEEGRMSKNDKSLHPDQVEEVANQEEDEQDNTRHEIILSTPDEDDMDIVENDPLEIGAGGGSDLHSIKNRKMNVRKATTTFRRRSRVEKVPVGHVWVQGDNKAQSNDSRHYGPVPLGLIDARVVMKLWPPSRDCLVEKRESPDRLKSFNEVEEGIFCFS